MIPLLKTSDSPAVEDVSPGPSESSAGLPPGDPPLALTGAELPSHLKFPLAPARPTFGDPISNQIATLLRLHPDLDRDYADVDLRKLMPAARRSLLEKICERLGIPPR